MSATLSTPPSAARHPGFKLLLGRGELYEIDELVNERASRRVSTLLERPPNLGGALDGALPFVQQRLDRNQLGSARLRSGIAGLERPHCRETRVQNVAQLLAARRSSCARER